MKKLMIILLFCFNQGMAQNAVSVDSLKQIVIQHISLDSATKKSISSADYGDAYTILELLTFKPIQETDQRGIYCFGLCGDDVPCWLLLYDPRGCKIMPYAFDYSCLGDLLDFFEYNQYSNEDIIKYLKAIYKFYRIEDSWGEKEIITSPTQR